jgi:hypothetical protein
MLDDIQNVMLGQTAKGTRIFLKTKWWQNVLQREMRFATLTVFRDKATTLIMKRNYRIIKP